ncbi:hypothetical protein Pelo_9471 [Pelomyxa schiedti]|nr:hypothetical protein Pelo_9471 [Pelomyxa schiedti]
MGRCCATRGEITEPKETQDFPIEADLLNNWSDECVDNSAGNIVGICARKLPSATTETSSATSSATLLARQQGKREAKPHSERECEQLPEENGGHQLDSTHLLNIWKFTPAVLRKLLDCLYFFCWEIIGVWHSHLLTTYEPAMKQISHCLSQQCGNQLAAKSKDNNLRCARYNPGPDNELVVAPWPTRLEVTSRAGNIA